MLHLKARAGPGFFAIDTYPLRNRLRLIDFATLLDKKLAISGLHLKLEQFDKWKIQIKSILIWFKTNLNDRKQSNYDYDA